MVDSLAHFSFPFDGPFGTLFFDALDDNRGEINGVSPWIVPDPGDQSFVSTASGAVAQLGLTCGSGVVDPLGTMDVAAPWRVMWDWKFTGTTLSVESGDVLAGTADNGFFGVLFTVNASGPAADVLTLQVESSGGADSGTFDIGFTWGTWHAIEMRFDGTDLITLVDGVVVNTLPGVNPADIVVPGVELDAPNGNTSAAMVIRNLRVSQG